MANCSCQSTPAHAIRDCKNARFERAATAAISESGKSLVYLDLRIGMQIPDRSQAIRCECRVKGRNLPILTGGAEGLAELSSPLADATIARCRPSIFRYALRREFPMPDTEAGSVLTIDVDRVGSETTVHCHGRLVAGVDDALYF